VPPTQCPPYGGCYCAVAAAAAAAAGLLRRLLRRDEQAADAEPAAAPATAAPPAAAKRGCEQEQAPAQETTSVEYVVTAEERNGEMHYLLKWCGRDESANTWVAQSALPDTHAIELVAAFEETAAAADELEGDDAGEGDDASMGEESNEFFVEALLDRRLRRRDLTYEYLVHWWGFDASQDSWEPAEGLPLDMREEFDASMRSSKRARRFE
jgi:hypothetical protein